MYLQCKSLTGFEKDKCMKLVVELSSVVTQY